MPSVPTRAVAPSLPACPWWCEDEEHWLEYGSRKHEIGVGAVDLPNQVNPEQRVTVACHITAFDFIEDDLVVSEPPTVVFIEYGGLPRSVLRCATPEQAEELARLATEAARRLRQVQRSEVGPTPVR